MSGAGAGAGAAERVFGVMRNFESDLNQGITIDAGLLARSNGWIVDQLVASVSAQREVGAGRMTTVVLESRSVKAVSGTLPRPAGERTLIGPGTMYARTRTNARCG